MKRLIPLKNLSAERILQRTKRFGRDVKKLPSDVQKEAYQVALLLTGNVFHPELNIRELTGFKGSYRVVISNLKNNHAFPEMNFRVRMSGFCSILLILKSCESCSRQG